MCSLDRNYRVLVKYGRGKPLLTIFSLVFSVSPHYNEHAGTDRQTALMRWERHEYRL